MKKQLALLLIALMAVSVVSAAGVVTTAPKADAVGVISFDTPKKLTPTKIEAPKAPHTLDGRTWAKRGEQFAITGRLLTQDGKPVVGRQVKAEWVRLSGLDDRDPGSKIIGRGYTKPDTTDSKGNYEIWDSCKEAKLYYYIVWFLGDKQYAKVRGPTHVIKIGQTKTHLDAVPQSYQKANTAYPLIGKVTNQDNVGIPRAPINVYTQTWDKSTLYGKKPGWSSKWMQTNERGEFFLYERATPNAVKYHYVKFLGTTQYFSSQSWKIRIDVKK